VCPVRPCIHITPTSGATHDRVLLVARLGACCTQQLCALAVSSAALPLPRASCSQVDIDLAVDEGRQLGAAGQ